MDVIAQEFVEKMRKMAVLDPNRQMSADFSNELSMCVLECIAAITFDRRLGCLAPIPNPEAQKLINSLEESFELTFQLDLNFSPTLWKIFPKLTLKKFIKVQNGITDVCKKYIDAAFDRKKNSKGPIKKLSVLEKLLEVDKMIAYNIAIDLFAAGTLTVSVFNNTLYILDCLFGIRPIVFFFNLTYLRLICFK